MKKSVFLILLLLSKFIEAQTGCTDPQAINYNASAIINDGSCIYNTTNYTTLLVSVLSDTISETSALQFYNNNLITINDSGGNSELYSLDTLGNLQHTYILNNAVNIDWEALAISESALYVGDFGNNNGNRLDLSIYKLSLSEIQTNADTLEAFKMEFKYEDQVNFSTQPNASNFDAEAFVFFQDSLHIFSKSWQSFYCKHYVLPSSWEDTAIAILKDSIYVNGLITDATIDKDSGRLILLGYKLDSPSSDGAFYSCFIHLFFDYPDHAFFSGNNRRIELGGVLSLGQTEGISWAFDNQGYISSEKITSPLTVSQKLRKFNFSEFFTQETTELMEINTSPYKLIFDNGAFDIVTSSNDVCLFNLYGEKLELLRNQNGWTIINFSQGIHTLFIDNQPHKIYLIQF